MNEIVNKFLLAGDLCLKCIYDNLDLPAVLEDHLLKIKREYKYLKKGEIHNIFIKTN